MAAPRLTVRDPRPGHGDYRPSRPARSSAGTDFRANRPPCPAAAPHLPWPYRKLGFSVPVPGNRPADGDEVPCTGVPRGIGEDDDRAVSVSHTRPSSHRGWRVSVPAIQKTPLPAMMTAAPFPSPTPAIPPNYGVPIVLTAPEQARLWELPEPAREQVLRWLVTGDRICMERQEATGAAPAAGAAAVVATDGRTALGPARPPGPCVGGGRSPGHGAGGRAKFQLLPVGGRVGLLATAAGGGLDQHLAAGDRSQGRASGSGVCDGLETRNRGDVTGLKAGRRQLLAGPATSGCPP